MADPQVTFHCDDCGEEVMAVYRDGKLVITDRRHGRKHILVLPWEMTPPPMPEHKVLTNRE